MSKSNKGISLIEAIVSIAIILVVVLAIGQIFPLALKVSNHAEQETIASNLAQAKIEETFALNYGDITTGVIEAKHRLASDSANPFYNYQRETSAEWVGINMAHSPTETGLKKITTTVYWQSPIFRAEKSITLRILISQHD